jgi:uncharacterized membrane protein
MAGDFTTVIAAWQPFYNLAGEKGDLVQFARQTLGNFLALMIISLVFMIPGQSQHGTGIPLLIIGVIMMWRALKLWKKFEFESKEQRLQDNAIFRSELLVPNTVCYLVLIFISVELLYGNTDYLSWMTMVIMWLLLAGSLSAWFLMLRLAKMAQVNIPNK